ncbi:flavin reductase family protein [Oceanobacillus piezotolerans]|uniref:Flavin reductase family protein n=1 Tax=Oceanobacillus piezotolerans TaxID=2448030 RepID=A0A498D538_9BACI|nr:flavin reductase family protein [Oceanobacillus piezotolerans]RLL41281.1 flavin reductase family protein [Oceanobacillus piezotolerans]
MLSFHPKDLTERENYKLLIGSIIPRPIAFVTSKSKDGKVNAAPFSYFNIVSSNPPMISVSIQRKNGVLKDTARNIQETKEFVVHIVDESNVEEINKTAASLAPSENEIDYTNLTQVDSETVAVPAIKEAKVRFECRLEKAITLGEPAGTDLIIGNIVQYHIAENIYDSGRINKDILGAVSRLAGHDYAKIGDAFTIERPK